MQLASATWLTVVLVMFERYATFRTFVTLEIEIVAILLHDRRTSLALELLMPL